MLSCIVNRLEEVKMVQCINNNDTNAKPINPHLVKERKRERDAMPCTPPHIQQQKDVFNNTWNGNVQYMKKKPAFDILYRKVGIKCGQLTKMRRWKHVHTHTNAHTNCFLLVKR